MKRLHFFLPVIAMTFALCCTSCSKDDEDDEMSEFVESVVEQLGSDEDYESFFGE